MEHKHEWRDTGFATLEDCECGETKPMEMTEEEWVIWKDSGADFSRQVKQVIVMRTDLNMRKGKMVAQGAHASIAFLTKKLEPYKDIYGIVSENPRDHMIQLEEVERLWIEDKFTKICVQVPSEADLLHIHGAAIAADLTSRLIEDAGLTEFKGIPTLTCCAIGPNWADEIDKITGDLRLL